MKAVLIKTTGEIQDVEIDGPEEPTHLGSLQSVLGGYVVLVRTIIPHTQALVNEDGRAKLLPTNARATRLSAPYLFSQDFIVGDMLIVGPMDDEGNFTDAPMGVAEFVKRCS